MSHPVHYEAPCPRCGHLAHWRGYPVNEPQGNQGARVYVSCLNCDALDKRALKESARAS